MSSWHGQVSVTCHVSRVTHRAVEHHHEVRVVGQPAHPEHDQNHDEHLRHLPHLLAGSAVPGPGEGRGLLEVRSQGETLPVWSEGRGPLQPPHEPGEVGVGAPEAGQGQHVGHQQEHHLARARGHVTKAANVSSVFTITTTYN